MQEAPYSLTVKVNGDLFTIRGDSADTFRDNLRSVVTADLASYIAAVQEVASGAAPAAVKPASQAHPVQAAPAPADDPFESATPAGPVCSHGPRKWREGTSKNGKPYRGWFCTSTNRNDQCPAEWA